MNYIKYTWSYLTPRNRKVGFRKMQKTKPLRGNATLRRHLKPRLPLIVEFIERLTVKKGAAKLYRT